jgi:hypothetical protein
MFYNADYLKILFSLSPSFFLLSLSLSPSLSLFFGFLILHVSRNERGCVGWAGQRGCWTIYASISDYSTFDKVPRSKRTFIGKTVNERRKKRMILAILNATKPIFRHA